MTGYLILGFVALKVFEQRNGMSQFIHWEINLDTMSGWFGGRRRK